MDIAAESAPSSIRDGALEWPCPEDRRKLIPLLVLLWFCRWLLLLVFLVLFEKMSIRDICLFEFRAVAARARTRQSG